MNFMKKQVFIPDREYFDKFHEKTSIYSRSGIFSQISCKKGHLFPIGNILPNFM